MARGTFNVAVSGMLAQQDKMSVIGNNIANSRTTGYKASDLSFTEEFVSHGGQFINGTHNQFGNGVKSSGVNVDWGAGAIGATSQPANIAIAGDGFFPVAFQGGLHYTRAGDFQMVSDTSDPDVFYLQRANGAYLLGAANFTTASPTAPTSANYVTFTDSLGGGSAPSSFEISPDGVVTALPTTITVTNLDIGLQRFNNPDSLLRVEGGLYRATTLTSASTTTPDQPGQNAVGTLVQGALEESNVDLVTEFTDMIISQKSFQANAKTIQTADEMLQTVLGLKR